MKKILILVLLMSCKKDDAPAFVRCYDCEITRDGTKIKQEVCLQDGEQFSFRDSNGIGIAFKCIHKF